MKSIHCDLSRKTWFPNYKHLNKWSQLTVFDSIQDWKQSQDIQPNDISSALLCCKDVVAICITPSFMYHCLNRWTEFKIYVGICFYNLSPRPINVVFYAKRKWILFSILFIIDQFYHKTFIVPTQKTTNLHIVKKAE